MKAVRTHVLPMIKILHKISSKHLVALLSFFVFLTILWLTLGLIPKPRLVNKGLFSQALLDKNHRLLNVSLTPDEKYRVYFGLSELPQNLITATLEQEDSWFYWHPGFNPVALVRGGIRTFLYKGPRIGGSTITMQLARMRFGIDSRNILGKLEQICYAIFLERHFTKDEILEAYLNLASYGGNIEGAGSGAIVYFHKLPKELSDSEAAALSVIPKSPKLRSPANADGISRIMEARTRLLPETLRELSLHGTALYKIPDLPKYTPHLSRRVSSWGGVKQLTIDLDLQKTIENQVLRFLDKNRRLGFLNASVLLLDWRTFEARAYLGSKEFLNAEISGQVDGITGKRSPGSTLKPFIYALALQQGLITPDTILRDTEQGISSYMPENFDRIFLGPLSATEALVRSRNVPAVILANQLRKPSLFDFLKASGITFPKSEAYYGLALVLGGAEVTLEDLVRLYGALARGGEIGTVRYQSTDPENNWRILSPESSYLTLQMLKENPRPNESEPRPVPIPWKTGTSWGYKDAWAIGVVGPYVLGVWLGNFDATPNPNFIGRDAAGPLFFSIADGLTHLQNLNLDIKPDRLLNLKKVSFCSVSGALPGPYCSHKKDGWFIPGVSSVSTCNVHRPVFIDERTGLRLCPGSPEKARRDIYEFWPSDIIEIFKQAGIRRKVPPGFLSSCAAQQSVRSAPQILSPTSGVHYTQRIGKPLQNITFSALADGDAQELFWFLDSEFVGKTKPGIGLEAAPEPGQYTVRVVDDSGQAASVQLYVDAIK